MLILRTGGQRVGIIGYLDCTHGLRTAITGTDIADNRCNTTLVNDYTGIDGTVNPRIHSGSAHVGYAASAWYGW